MAYDYTDPRWQKKRLEIMERDGWKCVACGDGSNTLHVHHVLYSGQPWETPDSFLQTLCEYCHEALGPHPKGGVGWLRLDWVDKRPEFSYPMVSACFIHCPSCGSNELDKYRSACQQCGRELYADCGQPHDVGPIIRPSACFDFCHRPVNIDRSDQAECRKATRDLHQAFDKAASDQRQFSKAWAKYRDIIYRET